jgi:hypothetical protein
MNDGSHSLQRRTASEIFHDELNDSAELVGDDHKALNLDGIVPG